MEFDERRGLKRMKFISAKLKRLARQSFRDRDDDVVREENDEVSRFFVKLFAVEMWQTFTSDRFISKCLTLQ